MRDEFVDRAWDPPARHWPAPHTDLIGGRDRKAGGTWLAVDPRRPAVAALLNGPPRPPLDDGDRPTRGTLALRVLAGEDLPGELSHHDRFHLLRADPDGAELWSWDGEHLDHHDLAPGAHIVVNAGLDAHADPLVPHFAPLLAALPDPGDDLGPARTAWLGLLEGDDLDPGDPRALIVRKEVRGRAYASTSSSFVALSAKGARYEFSPTLADQARWTVVKT